MGRKLRPLLCELHAHTTWSDGSSTVRELVDLHGRSGFDVLCVTDHVVRATEPRVSSVRADNYVDYLAEIEREGERARELYDLLVVPGLELTFNDADATVAGHAVAVGLRSFLGIDDGLDEALSWARLAGAALIAAHPYPLAEAHASIRGTARFAVEWRELAGAVDRFELFNRNELFDGVARERLPAVATGDVHRPEHLATWKTLVPCSKDERSIADYLRSRRPAYLAPLAPVAAVLAA